MASLYKTLTKFFDRRMIASGSHHPGIDVEAWGLPAGTALRYERPSPALRSLIADYAVLDSDVSIFKGPNSWLLPGSPRLWIALTPDVRVKMRNRPIQELGAAMLIGPSSVTMPVQSRGGVSIVIEPTPQGWARFLGGSAADVRDRIVPAAAYLPVDWLSELLRRLHASDRGAGVKPVIDAFLLERLPPPDDREERIARIVRLLAEGEGAGAVADWPARSGIGSARTMARLCEACFGYAPKLLQRRRRFLSVFAGMLTAPGPVDVRRVPAGYHDVPHFLRDARLFLGMTARQFLAMPMPYLRAALRARTDVTGAPLALLDVPDSDFIDGPGVLSV